MSSLLIALLVLSIISIATMVGFKQSLISKLASNKVNYDDYFKYNDKFDLGLGVSFLIMLISIVLIAAQ